MMISDIEPSQRPDKGEVKLRPPICVVSVTLIVPDVVALPTEVPLTHIS